MRGAVGLWVRADWRRRRASLLALAVLAGVAFGVVATAFAGARRTASSFDRLRSETRAYDHGIVIDAPGNPGLDHYDAATVRRVRRLPEIATSGVLAIYVAGLPGANWEFALNVAEDSVLGNQVERERVLRGRLPNPHRSDEVGVNEATVDQAHVDVGAVLRLATLTPEQRVQIIRGDPHAFDHGPLGPELRLKVVGVFRGVPDVLGRTSPAIFASPAFDHAYRGRVAYSTRIVLARRAPGTTAQALKQAVRRVTRGGLGIFDSTTEDKPARETISTLSVGLVVFAFLAGIAVILAMNQVIARYVASAGSDQSTLTVLGLTRAQRMRGVVANVAPAALIGALLAVLVSLAFSTLMPVGPASRMEPDPGMRFDLLVAATTAVAVIVVFVSAALLAALSLVRRERAARAGRAAGRSSSLATALGSAGAGPVVTTGVRLALDRRPPALPVRSALVGIGASVLVLVGALTFSASLDRLERDPQRWGYGWDLMLDTTDNGTQRFTHELAANHDLDGVSLLLTNFTFVKGTDGMRAYGLDHVRGSIGYALLSGAQPVGPDEVVIGVETARKLHLAVGDTLPVASCPCTGDLAKTVLARVRIVGTGLFPEDDDGNFSDALAFSGSGFARHVGVVDVTRVAVRIAKGRSLPAVARSLTRRYPEQVSKYSYPSRPGEVGSLAELHSFAPTLAIVAALLGLAALTNMLVTTVRRRRREIATLRSIGLTPRQAGRCIIWQSVSVAGLALVVGIPLGIISGAGVWLAATHGIGVATDASRPLLAIAGVAIAALALAIAIGLPVGSRAARMRATDALRTE